MSSESKLDVEIEANAYHYFINYLNECDATSPDEQVRVTQIFINELNQTLIMMKVMANQETGLDPFSELEACRIAKEKMEMLISLEVQNQSPK